MICGVCKGESFSQTSLGDYICNLCQTQSQDYLHEEAEYSAFTHTGVTRRQRRRVATPKASPAVAATEWNDGSAQSSYYDVLQRVIQSQCGTMVVELKCSPFIIDVAGCLWMKFLEKLGGDGGVPASRRGRTKGTSLMYGGHPKLTLTLAITFMACLQLREPVLLADIVRLVHDGSLLFLGVRKLVHPDAPYNLLLNTNLEFNRLNRPNLALQIIDLADAIGVMPPAPNLPLIERVISYELQLPASVPHTANLLLARLCLDFDGPWRPNSIYVAVAAIAVAAEAHFPANDAVVDGEGEETVTERILRDWVVNKPHVACDYMTSGLNVADTMTSADLCSFITGFRCTFDLKANVPDVTPLKSEVDILEEMTSDLAPNPQASSSSPGGTSSSTGRLAFRYELLDCLSRRTGVSHVCINKAMASLIALSQGKQ
eukprot:TRINITY_DN14779_c0_g1_i1.p1 TRINITY_DN14779_c0_g1~~TRINITY_DN14779_c0_g1_i1.p1  ORF type:complete len:430 (+),score=70.22 TRINITY_DN14779_c0_g1_i1:209-1498(+)